MKFIETKLDGAWIIEPELRADERGFFARGWCQREFEDAGLNSRIVQANISYNVKKGTLRGMHRQVAPYEETKLLRCTRGSIYDVIVDVRPDSPTFCEWLGIELTAQNHRMLFVPGGFLHGFQTLEDHCEIFYQVSEFYTPQAERGARYNDPRFAIEWPLAVSEISEKDASWPDFAD